MQQDLTRLSGIIIMQLYIMSTFCNFIGIHFKLTTDSMIVGVYLSKQKQISCMQVQDSHLHVIADEKLLETKRKKTTSTLIRHHHLYTHVQQFTHIV